MIERLEASRRRGVLGDLVDSARDVVQGLKKAIKGLPGRYRYTRYLKRRQLPDGSFGGLEQTIAALYLMLLTGNSSRTGSLQAQVEKVKGWLTAQTKNAPLMPGIALAWRALALIEDADLGRGFPNRQDIEKVAGFGTEGALLERYLNRHRSEIDVGSAQP
jgi:hypothetical protein